MDADARLGAQLSDVTYLPPELRHESAAKLGYRVVDQDRDRALFANDQGQAVFGFRGTDVKHGRNAVRDLLTDAVVLVGKGEKTPRYRATEDFVSKHLAAGHAYKDVSAVGHSLGGHQALHVGREFGITTRAYNPAATLPDVARSIRDRVVGFRRQNLSSFITHSDPVSVATAAQLTGRVHHVRQKVADPHALANFLPS